MVSNEKALSIEDVAAGLKTRAGFTGKYEDMVSYVKQFFDEMAYQLLDGFSVNTGYFSVCPRVGGLFTAARGQTAESNVQEKHRVSFGFKAERKLRRLADFVEIWVDDNTERSFIEAFEDLDAGSRNGRFTPGHFFRVTGDRIKVKGNNPDCGVWFVSTADPSLRFKVTRALATNMGRNVSGLIPDLPAGEYHVEIKTQYTVGGIDLKKPRTITGAFTLKAVG